MRRSPQRQLALEKGGEGRAHMTDLATRSASSAPGFGLTMLSISARRSGHSVDAEGLVLPYLEFLPACVAKCYQGDKRRQRTRVLERSAAARHLPGHRIR